MLCCASWFTDHTAALGSSLLCFPVSLHRVFLVESWDRRGWCGFPDFGVLGFFCFSLFFLSFCFVFIVVRTQSSDSWELGSVYNLFYLCNQCIYSCISLQILYIFLQNWFFREGNPRGWLFHTWHLQLFAVWIQKTWDNELSIWRHCISSKCLLSSYSRGGSPSKFNCLLTYFLLWDS